MRRPGLIVFLATLFSPFLFAQQPPPPLPPAVGNAVLLATNSAQVDRNVVVTRGDLVVNGPGIAPLMGELELSLDQGVRTPAGFAIKANGIDLDRDVLVAGEAHYNVLQNGGTILGAQVTPLAMPVIGTLPALPNRPAGTEDIVVPEGTQRILGRGDYAALVIGRDATLRLPGGPYTFTSIAAERGATIVFDGPGDAIVLGNMTFGADASIVAGPGITTKRRMFFVHGTSATFGANNTIQATVHVPNGSITAGESLTMLGSFVARDIRVARDSELTLRSGFRNLPPVAINQNVTVGSAPVTITLSGFDPDADPLTFAISLQPSFGNLGPITPTGPTSAVVVYTPREPDPNDVFTFRVTDSEGFTAMGVVTINEGELPGPPTTIDAQGDSVEVPPGRPTIINLNAVGPPGVPITISISQQPEVGSLGPLTQPSQMPPRAASVVYVPPPGYVGEDVFRFRACGTINGEEVCDEAAIRVSVVGPEPPTELAPDVSATTDGTSAVPVFLGNGDAPPPTGPGTSFLTPAVVAGEVADINGDGQGDNAAVPQTMSAGVGVRMHIEFDVANFIGLANELQTATVLLRTNRGADDTLATTFFAVGSNGDGQLTASDYESGAEAVPGAVMSVPLNQPVGADGQYSFDILAELRAALQAGFTHFAIQGRASVREPEGTPSGLHVYTTDPQYAPPERPSLGLQTQGSDPVRVTRVTSLPAQGTLTDSSGVVITSVPHVLPSPIVTYRAPTGFAGVVTFTYSVTEGTTTDNGTATVTVTGGDGDGR